MTTFTALSLNMHCGMEENYPEKLKVIARGIHDQAVDIVILQECVQSIHEPVVTSQYGVDIRKNNLAKQLVDELKTVYKQSYDYFFDWGNYGFTVLEEGLAVLSKYPIINTAARYVSKTTSIDHWWARKLIRVDIDIKGQPLSFYDIHLGWWDDDKEPFIDQMRQLMAWTKETPSLPYLMVGDFNNPAGSIGYQHIIESYHLRDLYHEVNPSGFHDSTFVSNPDDVLIEADNIHKRIDYFMTPHNQLQANSLDRIFTGKHYPIVSDHYGLLAKVSLKNKTCR